MSRIGHAEKDKQNPRILRGSCSDTLAHCLQKSGLSTHPFTVSGACIALSAIQKCWTQIRKHNAIENHHVFMVLEGRPALIKFLIKIFQKIAFWRPKSDHSLSIQWIPTGNLFEPTGAGLLSFLLGLLPRLFDCQICRFLSRMQPEMWEGETNKLWRYRIHVQNWPRWERQTKSTDSERKLLWQTGTLFTKKRVIDPPLYSFRSLHSPICDTELLNPNKKTQCHRKPSCFHGSWGPSSPY